MSLRSSEDTRLAFADELERRDAEAARALDAVERLQREVDELRTHLAAVSTEPDEPEAGVPELANAGGMARISSTHIRAHRGASVTS